MVKNLPTVQESWPWCFLKSSPDDFNMRPGLRGSLVAQTVKKPPAAQETWVRSLDQEDPLEEGMATHFSVLVWRIPWTEEPGRLQSMGPKESDATEAT